MNVNDFEAYRAQKQEKIERAIVKGIKWGSMALLTIILLAGSMYTVPERHVGIVKRFSEAVAQVDAGFHFKAPFIDSIEIMEIGTRKYEIAVPVATMNKAVEGQEQELQLPSTAIITANWNIPKSNALSIYKEYGGLDQFEDRILDPRVNRSVKGQFSKGSIEYAVANRELLRSAITKDLESDLLGVQVNLSDLSIKDIQFSKSIRNAISAKQKAKLRAEEEQHKLNQQNLQAQQQVNTANAERDSKKAIADGNAYKIEKEAAAEAEAIKLKGLAEAAAIKAKAKALKNNPLIVQLTAAQNWNGQQPQTVLSGGENLFMNMNAK